MEGLEFLVEMDVIIDDVYWGVLVIVIDIVNVLRISDVCFFLGD